MNIILGFNGGQQFSKVLSVFLFSYISKWLFLSKKFIHLFWKVLYKYSFIIIILPILTRTRNKVFLNPGSYIFTFWWTRIFPAVLIWLESHSLCLSLYFFFSQIHSMVIHTKRPNKVLTSAFPSFTYNVAVALIENVSRCNCRPILLVISNFKQISWIWCDLVNLINNLCLNSFIHYVFLYFY